MDAYISAQMELLGVTLEPVSREGLGERYHAALMESRVQGYTPVIVQASSVLAEAIELFLEDRDLPATPKGMADGRAMVLREADAVDVEAFFAERLREYLDYIDDEGEFGEDDPNSGLYAPDGELFLLKLPTPRPYELPAFIPMGGFNDCPDPATQVAVFKYWYETYGALPAAVTYDTWQLTVDRPPTTDDACYALAREHYAFSSDNILQSGGTLSTLKGYASALRGSSSWFFWWD